MATRERARRRNGDGTTEAKANESGLPDSDMVEVRRSPIHGRGVFARRRIRRGARIIEYVGEHIDGEEADRRYDDDSMKVHHTFLFKVDDDDFIDGGVGGNESRFINHSCEPNCSAYTEGSQIFIEALRTIQPDEELLYDYAYVRPGRFRAHWRKLYACGCGAPTCRGTILKPAEKKRPRRAAKGAARAKGTKGASGAKATRSGARPKTGAAKRPRARR